MGAFDWLKQTVGKAGDWLKQNVTPENVSKGASWLNQNIVQPGVSIAKEIPGVGGFADAIGKGANIVDSLGQKLSGRAGKVGIDDLAQSGKDLYGAYKDGKAGYGAAKQGVNSVVKGVRDDYNNIRSSSNLGEGIKRGMSTFNKYKNIAEPIIKKRRVQFS